ncbi:sugar ABC transporter substrate-binding protein [Umezawaea sp. Da 62-37]|uniref:sugar ABC transporter substrate-binding protein n=1 Tax=Umezawaea sp. Da 62-37 TaxID=3075927 RepID=UPI0028F6D216|nr:sugar ABC transporter substrate-binding protein [Umezawaea sp. Da 62-37]WNV82357.1 sugar ABC transporter substrate-binding protein [Umezawaea sp. Da 62-37]
MPKPAREPTFLPLTMAAAGSAADGSADPLARDSAQAVRHRAETANSAAADCWTALVAGCTSGRQTLVDELHHLSMATSQYAGTRWWLSHGSVHRRRVVEAEGRIDEAVRDGDGAEFAEAFVGYDQAVATVVVHVRSRMGSLTQ